MSKKIYSLPDFYSYILTSFIESDQNFEVIINLLCYIKHTLYILYFVRMGNEQPKKVGRANKNQI